MTLPIIEAILRGDFRPKLIKETVPAEELSQMKHILHQAKERTNLIELEKDIIKALDSHTQVGVQYSKDKELKDAIIHYIQPSAPGNYTRVYKTVLKNIFPVPEINTPYLRMYETILELEKVRTICAMLDLHSKMQDDSFIYTEVENLFNSIKVYCQELKAERYQSPLTILLRNMLIELYFSLSISFQNIISSKKAIDTEDDFEDFVYYTYGIYPSKDVTERFHEQIETAKQEKRIIQKAEKENEQEVDKQEVLLTKAEQFLEETACYEFLKMPMIVALESQNEIKRKTKALQLIEIMLENPAHAAAMLDYLNFFKWIKEKYEKSYTYTEFDKFCTRVVMGNKNGNAFKKYRTALHSTSESLKDYRHPEYIEQVIEEYTKIKNGI